MTEKTAITNPLFPKTTATRQLIDPTAFLLAMVGGPLIFGVVGAPMLLIPSIAALFGGPIYLAVGTPVMLFYMRRNQVAPRTWAWLAFVTHIALFLPIFLIAALNGRSNDITTTFLCFGAIFAPIWGAVSGVVYKKFERDFYTQTI